jgi:peptidoglycan/LPS O-acetylase OafA/YrhL
MEPKKFEYIDAMRGVAILLVLLVHVGEYGQQLAYFPDLLSQFISNGQCGVQVFLLVSAYTLMHSQYSRKDEPNLTRRFYLRRFFRVAPMYYVGIVYFTLQNFVGFNHLFYLQAWTNIDVRGLITNIFFVHGFSPNTINSYVPGGWSIAVEMTFYLIFPLLFKYITNLNRALSLVIGSLILQKVLMLSLSSDLFFTHNYFLSMWFPNQLPIFALGIFVFHIVNQQTFYISKINILLTALLCFGYIYLSVPTHFAYAFVFGILLICFHNFSLDKVSGFVLGWIGKISYSMYLVHFAVLYFIGKFHFTDYFFG